MDGLSVTYRKSEKFKKLRQRSRGTLAVLLAGALASSLTAGGSGARPPARRSATQVSFSTWYAPYVDATLPPEYPSADPNTNPSHQSLFGFVVAAARRSCTPSWGTYYSLSSIETSQLRLGSILSRMRAEGEEPIVSFGGEANQPLADACGSISELTTAYERVIDTYDLHVLDFDIEGAAQSDTAALARQAQAIHAVQRRAAAAGHPLGVWLTLPVTTTGMLPVAEQVVNTMLNFGVGLAGVNLMTMYFSPSPGDGVPMLDAVERALTASNAQLQKLFTGHGITLGAARAWRHMGATVQIGQAATPGQAFTVADAQGLVTFAKDHGLGRVSDWSANQDAPCAAASKPRDSGYSSSCSGVAQTTGEFGRTFAQLSGLARATTLLHATTPSSADPSSTTTITSGSGSGSTSGSASTLPPVKGTASAWSSTTAYRAGALVTYESHEYEAMWWSRDEVPTPSPPHPWDSPWQLLATTTRKTTASPTTTTTTTTPTSPTTTSVPPQPTATVTGSYPAWSPSVPYRADYKVIEGGDVYQAKWWNEGVNPKLQVASSWVTPWSLVGPAASSAAPWTPPTLPAGTYPAWSPSATYVAGDHILFQGVPYQAKWWNEDQSPASEASGSSGSPWKPLFSIPGEPSTA